MIELGDVERAAARLAGIAHRTPVLTSRRLNAEVKAELFLKAECFQRVGAFKFRGAYNALACLDETKRAAGVLAYSSGNHAQAVALSAQLHGVPAVIVMPSDAPAAKLAATRGYGAEVIEYDRYSQDREAIAAEIAAERGLNLVPPFDHLDVIAGQGTVALELFEEVGSLDLLVVCVGGGGLLSGCATVARAKAPQCRIVGVEPEDGDDVKQSLAAGKIVTVDVPRTIADGQQTQAPGKHTFAIMSKRVDEIVLVSDEELIAAMRVAFATLKVVLEPSGASALAAVLSGALDVQGMRVGVTLSGGNVAAADFARYLAPDGRPC